MRETVGRVVWKSSILIWDNGHVKPFDPRLLRYAKPARPFIIEIAALGVVTAALVIVQAFLISGSVSPVVSRADTLQEVLPTIGLLVLVVAVRAGVTYVRQARAHRAADAAVTTLRSEVTRKSVQLGPRWRSRHGTETATLLTRGLDDLDPYFIDFLPQLLLVVTVTPITLIAILTLDFWSALIALLALPMIPIFMVLIGKMTSGFSSKKLVAMERLGAQLLDVLTGIPTLKALGREQAPREHLVRLSNQNTRTTLQTLRVAFLSGGVLEFLSTLSVALVAVQVGMRMVHGDLDLFKGLVIIMLAPEVFEPVRQVGTMFHASNNGIAAAKQCFEILEEPSPKEGTVVPAPAGSAPIHIKNLSVAARGAWAPHDLNATISPGKLTVLVGASGAGKSTTVQVLQGFIPATRGEITTLSVEGNEVPISDLNKSIWWERMSWIPQHPTLVSGTVLSNALPQAEDPSLEALAPQERARLVEAAQATGFDSIVATLPEGWETPIGFGGLGLSVGQRQRLALTRTLMQPPGLLILDEPTAHLDALSEDQVVRVLQKLKGSGSTILVIAHRQTLVRIADEVVDVTAEKATEDDLESHPELLDDYELADLSGVLPGLLSTEALVQAGVLEQATKLKEEN